jgi:TnpA family transposase
MATKFDEYVKKENEKLVRAITIDTAVDIISKYLYNIDASKEEKIEILNKLLRKENESNTKETTY